MNVKQIQVQEAIETFLEQTAFSAGEQVVAKFPDADSINWSIVTGYFLTYITPPDIPYIFDAPPAEQNCDCLLLLRNEDNGKFYPQPYNSTFLRKTGA